MNQPSLFKKYLDPAVLSNINNLELRARLVVEGFITAGIVLYVKKMRPDIFEDLEGVKVLSDGPSMKKVLVVFAVCAVITGGALSWFASTYPDRLEWSIKKITGNPELPES